MIDRIGRIPILLAGLVTAGLACVFCGLVAGTLQVGGWVLRMLGWWGWGAGRRGGVGWASASGRRRLRCLYPMPHKAITHVLGCLQVFFAMVDKFGSDAAWRTLVVYLSDLLPTSIRSVQSLPAPAVLLLVSYATP